MEIRIAASKDVPRIYPTILELRPHLTIDNFEENLQQQMEEGYRLIFIGNDEEVFAVAGFRTLHFLFSGKTLYVDDLVTAKAHKKKGYASMLLEWMKGYASSNNYDHFSLDSGFSRKDAHRLYLNNGLEIKSFHFGMSVSER